MVGGSQVYITEIILHLIEDLLDGFVGDAVLGGGTALILVGGGVLLLVLGLVVGVGVDVVGHKFESFGGVVEALSLKLPSARTTLN